MFELRTLGGLELLRTVDGADHAIPMQAKRFGPARVPGCTSSPGSFRRRDTLLLLRWPDLDQDARGALRQALHFLRKTLGESAIRTRGEDEIALEPAAVCSDARRLEAAVAAGQPDAALTLYRGDFLEGVFVSDAAPELEDWISAERLPAPTDSPPGRPGWRRSGPPTATGRESWCASAVHCGAATTSARLAAGRSKILDGVGDRAGAAALYDEFARRVAARTSTWSCRPETRSVLGALRARRASGPA